MLSSLGAVACVGDVYCDIVVRGVTRIPSWGEEVFGEEPAMCPGGIANVAVGLAKLGVATRLLGRSRADDTIGNVLSVELSQHDHLAVDWLRAAPSTAMTVAIPHASERAMISYAPPPDDRPIVDRIPWDTLERVTHLHVGGWSEGPNPLADQQAILARARALGITTSLDVSLGQETGRAARIRALLEHVDVFLPNAAEACWITEADDPAAALDALADLVPTAVVKLGPRGVIAASGLTREEAPAHRVPIVDTTGAGDAFAAGFLHGHVRRWPLWRSLRLANVCGAWSVSRVGSSISTPTRVEAFTALERGNPLAVDAAAATSSSEGRPS
jgi:sugar/nucleoside kinase (ribokinase family)